MNEIWACADDGQQALGYFGSSVSSASVASIIVTLCLLLPVDTFAPGYTFWMRNPTAGLPVFAITFKQVYPELYQRIANVGSLTGISCQHEIRELTVALYGMFARQIHPAFIQALMLFIWCSDGSPQADLLNTMLLEYIQSPTDQLQALRRNCGNMQASGWSSASLGGLFSTTQLSSSVGYTRLCPSRNRKHFYTHWVFLWTCAVETLTRSRYESTPEEALRHIDEALFEPQGSAEDMKSFMSRIKIAYERTRSELLLINRLDRLPHEDTLVRLVYRRAQRSVSLKVKEMLQTTDLLTERDMTMPVVVALYLKAAYRRQQQHTGLDEALAESAPPSGPAPTKPAPPKPAPTKPARNKPRVPQAQPGTPPAPPQAPPGRQREAADQTGLLPNKTKHIPEAKRTEMAKDPRSKCHNCGDDGAFPAHPPAKCPFLRWDRTIKRGTTRTSLWLANRPPQWWPGAECVGSAQRIDVFGGQIDIVDLSSIYDRYRRPPDRRNIVDVSLIYRRYIVDILAIYIVDILNVTFLFMS